MYENFLRELGFRALNLQNFVGGKELPTKKRKHLIRPINGSNLLQYPDTQVDEIAPFLESLKKCPKSGLHNPIKNVERYVMLGQVCFKAAMMLEYPTVEAYFARLIQSVMPKSYIQCLGEVRVTKQCFKNFSGDNIRFLAEGKMTPGDHFGQQPQDYRWPYGPVVIISPFNFPLEIPALQLIGALAMGNKVLLKPATTVGLVMDQFLMLLHECGLPLSDVDLIHCKGSVMNELLKQGRDIIRLVQFTGSSTVAEEISQIMRGKVRIEDAGFDWKIIGPDYKKENYDYIAWQCDQDAYAASGQKCSATSILFVHKKWRESQFLEYLGCLAAKRNLADLTVGPVLTLTTEKMLEHIQKLSRIRGAYVAFGGVELEDHHIPKCYGAIYPTAVYVPLKEILACEANWKLVTTEIFGPVQVFTDYTDAELPLVLKACERMENHLTAAVVSDDPVFVNKILGATVNGTTYAGIRARTTGAPQNHWFGPCGDPRGAGIGTPDAIIKTWSSPRCIIRDVGPIDYSAELVQS